VERLAGKRIFITGASSGLGKACALRLAAHGALLTLIGRNAEALQSVAGEGPAKTYICDLADEGSIKALVSDLKKDGVAFDGCVLAAGLHEIRPLVVENFANLLKMWAVNVQGSLGLLAAVLRAKLLARGSAVVLFSSIAARAGGPGLVSYAASKGAIEAATRSLALELAQQRIRVNAVAPGVVRTPMTETFLGRLSPEQVARIEAEHPLGIGQPEDVAGPVEFLLSDDARWITGSVLVVDGGFSVA